MAALLERLDEVVLSLWKDAREDGEILGAHSVRDRSGWTNGPIETYRARIVDKLGLRSRADLTRYALEMGLLNPVPSSPG